MEIAHAALARDASTDDSTSLTDPRSDQSGENGKTPAGPLVLATSRRRGRLRGVGHEVQPAIATIDRPTLGLMAAQQALLIEACIGPRTVELVAAVDHGAEKLAGLPAHPAQHLLQRGGEVHRFGN